MNMFELMTDLLRRAGRETNDWAAVAQAASGLPQDAAKIFHELSRRLLAEIAAKKVVQKAPERPAKRSPAERAAYEKAVREAPGEKRHKSDPVALHRRLFSLASSFGFEDDAVNVLEEHGADLYFDQIMNAARYLVRQGRADEAWSAIERALPSWSGGYTCSVGPVEALVDPELGPLFTPQRGEKLLQTPRGR